MDDGVADYPLNWVKTRLYCDQFVTIFLFSDKWSISMYLNDKTTPSEQVQSDIAVSLGLTPDYFEQEETPVTFKPSKCEDGIPTLTVHEVAKLMHKHTNTIALGLQQGVFPWGYAIHTSEHRWSYFINAKRFAEIEGVI